MRIVPSGILSKWLVEDGRSDLADMTEGFEVPDAEYTALRNEADTRHPEYTDEQKVAWAVMCVVGRKRLSKAEQQETGNAGPGIERIARAHEVMTQEWRKLRGGFAALESQLTALHDVSQKGHAAVELAIAKGETSALEAVHRLALGLSLNRVQYTTEQEANRALWLRWTNQLERRERWMWAWRIALLLGLWLLAAATARGQEYRSTAYRIPHVRLMPQTPHDPIFILLKDEGTLATSARSVGRLTFNCVGAGIACTYSNTAPAGPTWTMTVPGGGPGGGITLTVNGGAMTGTAANLSDTTPAAAANGLNVKWQIDGSDNVSAYVPMLSITKLGTVDTGVWNGTAIGLGFGGTNQTSWTAGRCVQVNAGGTALEAAAAACGDIADDAVTDAKLRESAGVSVIGRSANSTGNPADIAASADGQVLRRASGTVGFGAVDLADADAVTGTLPAGNLPATVVYDTATVTRDFPLDCTNPRVKSLAGNAYFDVEGLGTADVDVTLARFTNNVDGRITCTGFVPNELAGTPAAKIIFDVAPHVACGGSQNFRFNVRYRFNGSTGNLDTALTAETEQSIAGATTAHVVTRAMFPSSGSLSSAPAAGDTVIIEIQNDGADANDTCEQIKEIPIGSVKLRVDVYVKNP